MIALLIYFIIMLIVIIPGWKIFKKAGLNPALSLFLIIPFLGLFIALIILAFANWPATQNITK